MSDDVSIAGAGQMNTTIDGNATDRVFYVDAGNGVVEISGVTIQNGYALLGSGGGILAYHGSLSLIDSTVSGNTSTSTGGGGGIYAYAGAVTLTNSTVSENTAYFDGGGIRNHRRVWATNSTVSGNTAYYGNGGGIWNTAAGGFGRPNHVSLYNSTVSGNVAAEHGGGIYNQKYANLSINNSTVSGNTAYVAGGGIYRYFDSMNSIVADNSAPSGANCSPGDSGGTPFSFGYNLTDDTSCGFTEPTDLVVDAMLGPLQDNGGPTETHDLLPGSPAIDAAPTTCPPPATDQRGVARPQGGGCDIGAVEFVPEPQGWLMLVGGIGLLGVFYRRRVQEHPR